MNKLLTKIVGLALGLSMAIGVGVTVGIGSSKEAISVDATGEGESVYKTAKFGSACSGTGSSSTAVSNYTSTNIEQKYNNFSVYINYFNNNGNGWAYAKTGNKTSASVGTIITKEAIDVAITSVDVTIDAITVAKVNSIKLYSSSNNSSWTEEGSFTAATGTKTVTLSDPTEDLYYKIAFDCQQGTSNGLVTVSQVNFNYVPSDDPALTLSDTELTIAKDSTNTFTVEAANLTDQLTVTSGDTSKVTVDSISPTPANPTEDGTYTVTLGGAAVTTSAVTITVASAADSLSKTLTASVEQIVEYPQITDGMTNGTYVLYYSGKAMNTTVTNNRLQYEEVTPSNNKIQDPADNIIWKVRKASADYYNLYNAVEGKYAAATSSNNQAQMLEDGADDKALWTITGTNSFEFVNKARDAAGVNNKYLRNNGGYGFACYATGTGGALSLYGFHEDVLTVTSNSATVDKGSNTTVTLGVTNPQGTATYSASSGDTSIATVSVSGTTLTINGVGVGTTTVTASLLIDSVAVDFVEIEVTVNSSVDLDEIVIKADGSEVAGQTVHLSQGNNLS